MGYAPTCVPFARITVLALSVPSFSLAGLAAASCTPGSSLWTQGGLSPWGFAGTQDAAQPHLSACLFLAVGVCTQIPDLASVRVNPSWTHVCGLAGSWLSPDSQGFTQPAAALTHPPADGNAPRTACRCSSHRGDPPLRPLSGPN